MKSRVSILILFEATPPSFAASQYTQEDKGKTIGFPNVDNFDLNSANIKTPLYQKLTCLNHSIIP